MIHGNSFKRFRLLCVHRIRLSIGPAALTPHFYRHSSSMPTETCAIPMKATVNWFAGIFTSLWLCTTIERCFFLSYRSFIGYLIKVYWGVKIDELKLSVNPLLYSVVDWMVGKLNELNDLSPLSSFADEFSLARRSLIGNFPVRKEHKLVDFDCESFTCGHRIINCANTLHWVLSSPDEKVI